MKKFGKILLGVVLALVMVIPFTVAGCDVGEATKEGIESATNLVPVEYSQELAKNVYLASVAKSKVQSTVALTTEYRTLEYGSLVSSCARVSAYWRNNADGSTDFALDAFYLENISYITKIGDTYYSFNQDTHEYSEDVSSVSGGESTFILANKVYGGMCYDDANSKIMVKYDDEDLSLPISVTINIKNSLIVGYTATTFDEDGLVKQVVTGTYEYNKNLDDVFANLPTSLDGWTQQVLNP